ncbi:putative Chymotrypsinogen A [Hypsibius exemplaris]|uniref:Chymotrypsinogen A n=1 Tax=Hypsibius exemplaris TaxID=2072580 RepID=A0A9X6NNL6_HYPEX|nr:putative Chymotrypsinogen A [Hypsibius exemplaris]
MPTTRLTVRVVLLLAVLTGGGCRAQSFNDSEFGDITVDDRVPVAGINEQPPGSIPVTNQNAAPEDEDDLSDYIVDDDVVIANGSFDAAIQPNATMPELAVSSAIINGMPVPRHKYPFMVSLQEVHENFHFCGGSLITSIHVITAAHCLTDENGRPDKEANHFRVGVGMHNHKGNSDNHYFRVKRIQIHQQYRGVSAGYLNDIALLTLDESVTRRRGLNAGVITLPAGPRDDAPPWTTVRAIGWGLTENAVPGIFKDPPLLLQGALFRVLNSVACSKQARERIAPSKICIDSSHRAACEGDSGGPLFRQLPSRKYQLIGIASYVAGSCLQKGSANVFTRVSHHVHWIKAALRSDAGSQSPSSQCRRISEGGLSCLICVRGSQHSKQCSRPSSPGIDWRGRNWAHYCDFHGNDISNHNIGPELCGPKCQTVPECTHFAFNPHYGKCWLKRGTMDKKNAQYHDDSGRICGVRV